MLKVFHVFLPCQSKENEEMRISLAELSSGSSRDSGDGNDNDIDFDRDGEAWCVQDGRVYEQGEDWDVDSCTSCACQVSAEQISRHEYLTKAPSMPLIECWSCLKYSIQQVSP